MQTRKLFFGGNWKCNNNLVQTKNLVEGVVDKLEFDPSKVGTNLSNIRCHCCPYLFAFVHCFVY